MTTTIRMSAQQAQGLRAQYVAAHSSAAVKDATAQAMHENWLRTAGPAADEDARLWHLSAMRQVMRRVGPNAAAHFAVLFGTAPSWEEWSEQFLAA